MLTGRLVMHFDSGKGSSASIKQEKTESQLKQSGFQNIKNKPQLALEMATDKTISTRGPLTRWLQSCSLILSTFNTL